MQFKVFNADAFGQPYEEMWSNPNLKEASSKCELCKEIFSSSSKWSSIQEVLKHKKINHPEPIINQYRSIILCDLCDFNSKNDVDMKRHTRDKHDILTKSTSPQPKKKRRDEPKDYKTKESEIVSA